MSQELIYTSAPRGLKPGTRGFCTVQCTQGMTQPLAERLESLSGYRHLFAAHDAQARLNPVIFLHLILTVGGRKHHVLSRIADAGLDYTQRSNKFAHHLALDPLELMPSGPAWALSQPGFMQSGWDSEPKLLAIGRRPPPGAAPAAVCRHWQELTGDAGWGGVLAETAVSQPARQVCLLFQPGQALLPLVAEALALVPAARRWEVTFSTWFTKLPPGVECQWRFLLAGSAEAKAAVRQQHALLIDLTASLPLTGGGPWVQAARTGVAPPEAAPARRMASAPAGINLAVDDDLHHAPVLPPQAQQAEYGMAPMMPMLPGQSPLPRPARRRSKTKIAVIASACMLACLLVAAAGYAMLKGGQHLLATADQSRTSGFPKTNLDRGPKSDPSGANAHKPAAAKVAAFEPKTTQTPPPPEKKTEPTTEESKSSDSEVLEARQDGAKKPLAPGASAVADSSTLMVEQPAAALEAGPFNNIASRHNKLQLPPDESHDAKVLVKLSSEDAPTYDMEVVAWEKFFDKANGEALKIIPDPSGTNWDVHLDVQFTPGGGRNIGQFTVVEEGLSFKWIHVDWRLRNCLLKLHAEPGGDIVCALREPLLVSEATIDFKKPNDVVKIDLPDTSESLKTDLLRLHVEVDGLQDATVEPKTGARWGEAVTISIPCPPAPHVDKKRSITVTVKLKAEGTLQLEFKKVAVAAGSPPTGSAFSGMGDKDNEVTRDLSIKAVGTWTDEAVKKVTSAATQLDYAENELKSLGDPPKPNEKDPKQKDRKELKVKIDERQKRQHFWEQEKKFCSELKDLIAKLKGQIRFKIYYDLGDHKVVLAETSHERE